MIVGVVTDADPEAAAAAARRAASRQGVWVGQSTENGIKDIYIRTEAPNAIWFDASTDRIADGLGLLGDLNTKDVRRGRAVGVLAQPQRALDLFAAAGAADAEREASAAPRAEVMVDAVRQHTGPRGADVDCRPPATLYLHLSADAVSRGADGVARFEGVGPVTIEQARDWLRHCSVTIKPVIDLANQIPVDSYEVPDRLREAVVLRNPVDVFPFATGASRHHDFDHTEPYRLPDDGGPPGQTRLDNLAL